MAINRADFAEDCVDQALNFVVNPQFLAAVAELLSGINDDVQGDKIGPFRITQAEWNEKGSDPAFQLNLQPAHISRPGMQCIFAALMTFRAQKRLLETLGRYPTLDELYAEWPNAPVPPGKSLQKALDDTRDLVAAAVDAALQGLDTEMLIGGINLDTIPSNRHDIARMIVAAFAQAGYGKLQQGAALANAIAESGLNPKARSTPPEDSVGLFQLNRNGGLGADQSVADLEDPANNIAIIIKAANKVDKFKAAASLHDAVATFVREIEKPANAAGEVIKRLAIAQKLVA
jgi:hypothetical protein